MKKWIIPCLSLLLIAALVFVSSPYYGSKKVVKLPAQRAELPGNVDVITGSAFLSAYKAGPQTNLPATLDEGAKTIPAIFGQMDDKEEKEQEDSHFILLLKHIQEALNGWLKSINERIESEDVTKIEVRFLEILRSILEWIKEKIDAKIESSPPQKRQTEWVWPCRA